MASLTHVALQVMVGLGTCLMVLSLAFWVTWLRQPWAINGVLRTADAVRLVSHVVPMFI